MQMFAVVLLLAVAAASAEPVAEPGYLPPQPPATCNDVMVTVTPCWVTSYVWAGEKTSTTTMTTEIRTVTTEYKPCEEYTYTKPPGY